MKNFTRETYIPLTEETVKDLMLAEYPKYRKITDDFVLNGLKYYVCKRVNMHPSA